MSLINEALLDLDKRNAPSSLARDTEAGASFAMDEKSRWRTPVFVLALLLVGAGILVFNFAEKPFLHPTNAALVAESSAIDPEKNAQTEIFSSEPDLKNTLQQENVRVNKLFNNEVTQVEALPAPSSQENVDLSLVPETRVTIDNSHLQQSSSLDISSELLKLADQALLANQLTRPAEASALTLYQSVLDVEPNNARALQGLENVKTRYAQLMLDAYKVKDISRLQSLLNRSSLVGLTKTDTHVFTRLVEQWKSSQPNRTTEKNTLALADEAQFLIEKSVTQGVSTNDVQHESSQKGAQESAHETQQLQVEKSLASKELSTIAEVNQLVADGAELEAIQKLEAFVGQYPSALESRVMLFDVYMNLGLQFKARSLATGFSEDRPYYNYVQAKLLGAANRLDEARLTLENNRPGLIEKEKHFGYLAALYQAQNNHEQALSLYEQLLSDNQNSYSYWLGYAVSAEASKYYSKALGAYQRAETFDGLNTEISQFISQRIKELSRLVARATEDN